jgi:hypothetical protein
MIIWLLVAPGLLSDATVETPPTELNDQDYAVYAAVLKSPPLVRDRATLVVLARTAVPDSSYCHPNPKIIRSAPYGEALADFVAKCDVSLSLQARFASTLNEQLLSHQDLEAIFHGPQGINAGWDTFRSKWPGARGFFELSRVGFSPDGKRAFVLVSEYCGTNCGRALYFPVAKDDAGWKLGVGIMAGEPRLE